MYFLPTILYLIGVLDIQLITTATLEQKFHNTPIQAGLYSNLYHDETEVTTPIKVHPNGEHLSHDVTLHHDDSGNDESFADKLHHFNVSIANRTHFLVLQPSTRFMSKSLIIERVRRDVHIREEPMYMQRSCHFHGKVSGMEDSKVALSACDGLTGLIHIGSEKYYIEPKRYAVTTPAGREHLVFKRSAVLNANGKRKRKKKKRSGKNCGTKEPRRISKIQWEEHNKIKIQSKQRHRHFNRVDKFNLIDNKHKTNGSKKRTTKNKQSNSGESYGYHKRLENTHLRFNSLDDDGRNIFKTNMEKHRYKGIQKRSTSSAQYVEALIVADTTMVEFHEYSDLTTYLLTIMNMVSSMYADPSIGNLIQVTVVKIIVIEDPLAEPELNVSINADLTLRNFCKWQKGKQPGNDSHPHHHDVAILVTRKDICARKNEPCNTLGVANVGGMCKTDRSCSVNEDNGITLAHTITHEMGHNFGMYHDTDKIGCKAREGNKLFIMTPSFEADTLQISWSRCSRRDITSFLDRGKGDCLSDKPTENYEYKYEYENLPPGSIYNAEFQCKLQFGEDATLCASLSEICTRLWCEVNGTCTSQLRPAASGTNCGKHMWCQDQSCVPIESPPMPVDGAWGEWTSWSECSRSCGLGVSISERECDHPAPSNGGKFCVGERRRYKTCNTDPCPSEIPSFRALQCSAYNNHTYNGKKYEWLPYFDNDESCELYCTDAKESVIVPWGEHAADGTPCNIGTRDICIAGICRKIGCDFHVGSNATEDRCGVCQGDGSTCSFRRGNYKKQSMGAVYREITVIPPFARNILIETQNSENYIAISSESTRQFYLNGNKQITLSGQYTVAGVTALYKRNLHQEIIKIPGPIRESIILYIIYKSRNSYNPGVRYQFTVSIRGRRPTKRVQYTWMLDEWSQCSVTCGGGVQTRKPYCRESVVQTDAEEVQDGAWVIVGEENCSAEEEPTQLKRTCNEEPCPSKWWIGPWQNCPVTCVKKGEKPFRGRSVMCVDALENALPDNYCSQSDRPKEREPCRGLPSCIEEN